MTKTVARLNAGALPPLCSRYFSVHFDEQRVDVIGGDGSVHQMAGIWAQGLLVDGDREVLGVWPAPVAGQAFWRGVFDEFAVRGVKRISFVFANAVTDIGSACPGAQVLPHFMPVRGSRHDSQASGTGLLGAEARGVVREAASAREARAAFECLLARSDARRSAVYATEWPQELVQFEPFYALRSERGALVRRGDEALEYLGRSLSRAVCRHGPFADVDAAVSFVASTLARAEVRFSSSVPAAARLRARSVGRMAARAGAAAPGR